MPSALLVRAVFGLLVLATLGGFFAIARLKTSTPVVERVFFRQVVSPNGDGRKDSVVLRFDLPERDRVTVQVVDARGDVVRTLADDVPRGRGARGIRWDGRTARLRWDGRDDAGRVVPDGVYRMRVLLREEGRSVTAPRELRVDTTPPRPEIVAVTPPTIVPGVAGARGRARIRYSGPQDPAPEYRVWRTDVEGAPQEIACFRGPRFRETATWDGYATRGCADRPGGAPLRPAPDGVYAITVTAEDEAGNRGSAPPRLPPARATAERRTGVSVRYLTVTVPLVPVEAGRVARVEVGPVPRRLRWRLDRLGGGRVVARGRASAEAFGLRVPAGARTGVHMLRVQAGGRRAVVPIAIRRPRGTGAGDVLVVLPSITWQGRNPVDDDRDGFPDTLDTAPAVPLERPFAHGRPPVGFLGRIAPVLRYLDRTRTGTGERLRYELTTDLALARGTGPRLDGRPGVLFPGSERWLTEDVDAALREFVEDGGRVASFGVDAFRRRVSVTPDALAEPSAPEPRNIFGEAVADHPVPEPVSMIASTDRLGLFRGTDGFVGLFGRFEVSRARPPGSELLSAAAPPDAAPAFVAYELGDGVVVRAGTPGWGASVLGGGDAATVTRRTWALISR